MINEWIGIGMPVIAYGCYAIFLWKVTWRIILLIRAGGRNPQGFQGRVSVSSVAGSAADVIFLTRLYRVNKALWAGEWLMHMSLIFIAIRHLRYILYPVPEVIVRLQNAGIYAGYVLPLSLVYILVMKMWIQKKPYFSTQNFFLLILLAIISVTGILMKNVFRPDVTGIKDFMLSILAFLPVRLPDNMLFGIHFNITLVFLMSIPSHFIAAPYTILDARMRDENIMEIIHEK